MKSETVVTNIPPSPTTAPLNTIDWAHEANHRVANNLSAIAALLRLQQNSVKQQGGQYSAAEVSTMLAEIAGRIAAVGLMHRLLLDARDAEMVDLGSFVRALCNPLVASLSHPDQVVLSFDLSLQCRVRAGQAVPLALIVSEAVTNALKHAHPTGVAGFLRVTCRKDSERSIQIEVADDGIGLPEGFDAESDGGVGFKVIRALCKQLKAHFSLDDGPLGLSFRLHVPMNQGAEETIAGTPLSNVRHI